ncbi:MAG TPA: excinuclease ABC subunit UvrC [Polyangiaceae bacterium]|nr:excinuclease ABC subunit UvrC [Polyangiaceae bacterium]
MLPDAVVQKVDALPAQSGVYLFKDKKGTVVYVGKAKSLRARVRSYFQDSSGDARAFIPILQRTIGDLETIVTANEKEATILENNLVKEHRPRFNVKLRDDKDFITLRLGSRGSAGAEWPRLEVVRRPTPDGARHFGPYHSATAARRTLHLVNKHFQLRTCSDVELASRRRPCLQHQIKRCPAPCVLPVDRAWYAEQVDSVAKFLEGRHDELSRELEDRMKRAAREMRFELAAVYRDQLRAIEKVREEQRVVTIDDVDRDVVGFYREGDLVEIALLHVRAGKLADVATYSIRQAEIPDEEIVAAFLAQHHGAALAAPAGGASGKADRGAAEDCLPPPDEEGAGSMPALVPDEIILPCEPEGIEGIADWLADRAGHKVTLIVPKRGHRVDLLAMANDNARHSFIEKQRQSDDVQERLRDLQSRLRLASVPRRIECCDISHSGGKDTVGAIVAMADGELDKKRYRTFNVRGDAMPAVTQGNLNDDYGAMYEVLARRFRRAIKAAELPGALAEPAEAAAPGPRGGPRAAGRGGGEDDAPDLFVVDGGRGQLAVALAAAHDLGLHDLAIVGLAKERETLLGEALTDRVYLPGQKNPIPLKSSTTSLFLLARLRDEAHRFSNRARLRLGKKRQMHSPIDDVKGLGPKAKKALLRHIGNFATIRAADDATLLAVPGVTARHVRALRASGNTPVDLHASPPTPESKRQRS